MTGNEILAEVRRLLYESSADLWTDDDLIAHINGEIRQLPYKGIYLEELYTTSKVKNQQDYALPSNTVEIERVEENFGTTSAPDWQDIRGWSLYGGGIWFDTPPTDTRTIRAWIQKSFTAVAANTTESDVPEEKLDIVIYGAAIRAYQQLIGYLVDSKNYDAIVKPDGVTIPQVRAWIQELKSDRDKMLTTLRKTRRPRQIDMVG